MALFNFLSLNRRQKQDRTYQRLKNFFLFHIAFRFVLFMLIKSVDISALAMGIDKGIMLCCYRYVMTMMRMMRKYENIECHTMQQIGG